jgi:NAD-dependent dihydropyrimidine dehydrogenase PreA subunit/flavodoxin
MKIFYFTSTGNNLYIAKKLGGNRGQLYSIPKLLKEKNFEFEDDKIGIIFPCYYFGTPRIVKNFIEKVKLKSDYIFAIMSYGNISAGGTSHFLRIAEKSGIKLSYINEIIMIDNYLPLYDIDKQLKNVNKKDIENNLSPIISDIHSGRIFLKKKKLLYKISTSFAQLYYKINIRKADKRFFVEDSCNSCHVCEKVCPVKNIKVDGKPVFLHNCEECFACIHHCPQNSIRLTNEKSRTRFINEHIRLKEIIESNN